MGIFDDDNDGYPAFAAAIPPRRGEGMGGGGGGVDLPAFVESRMGGSVTLESPFADDKLPLGVITTMPAQDQTIIEANLREDLKGENLYTPGSWVLTIDAFAEYFQDVPAGLTRGILPIRARINIATGGSTQQFETDVRNQSFQLPAANVKVDIGWHDYVPQVNAALGWQYQIPRKTVVRAQIQRGYSNGRATRSQYIQQPDPATGVSSGVGYAIPNFARCLRVWGIRDQLNPAATGFWDLTAAGGRIRITGEDAASGVVADQIIYYSANLVDPGGVPVPTNAQAYAYYIPAGGPNLMIGPLEWELSL